MARWARAAAPLGLHAALSAPLVAGDRTLGAMKVYAELPAAFDGLRQTVRRLTRAVLAHQHGVLQDDASILLASWGRDRTV